MTWTAFAILAMFLYSVNSPHNQNQTPSKAFLIFLLKKWLGYSGKKVCKYSEKYDDVNTNNICEQPLWPSSSSAPPLWWNRKREQIAKLLEFWIHKVCNLQEINIIAGMKKCWAISGQILQQLELKESFPISRDDQLKNTTIRLLYPAESSNFNIFNFQFPEMID